MGFLRIYCGTFPYLCIQNPFGPGPAGLFAQLAGFVAYIRVSSRILLLTERSHSEASEEWGMA